MLSTPIARRIGTLAVLFIVTASAGHAANGGTIIYASASAGDAGGYFITDVQYLGVRFNVAQGFDVTAIGGEFLGHNNGSIFGALVRLNGPSDFPDSSDFTSSDVLGHATLSPLALRGDQSTGLSVHLAPGTYGLVFGSGRFGTTGSASLYGGTNNPPASFFFWSSQESTGGIFHEGTIAGRFFVEGTTSPSEVVTTPLPSPLSGGIALSGLVVGRRLFRRPRRPANS